MIDDALLESNIQRMAVVAHYFALVAGVCLVVSGIFKLRRYSEARTQMSQQHTITSPLLMIVGGAALLSFPTVIRVLLSIFYTNSSGRDDTVWSSALRVGPVLYFIRFLGFVSFIRGCMTFAKHTADSQQGVIGKGMMYLFSGVCLMHIVGVVNFINNNFIGLSN